MRGRPGRRGELIVASLLSRVFQTASPQAEAEKEGNEESQSKTLEEERRTNPPGVARG